MPIGGRHSPAGARGAQRFSWWDRLLLLAGLRHGAGLYLRIFAPIVAGALLAWAFLGALSGFVTLLLLTVGAYFLLWLRADKRQRRMISQLPAFLDNMVRLITIGNSMASAFQTAAASADAPLREVVETAAALSRSAKELDEALAHVSRQYGLKELYGGGGGVDRAALRRPQRSGAGAHGGLHARRQPGSQRAVGQLGRDPPVGLDPGSLPLGIAGFIIVANNDLFVGLWEDPLGFKMLATAVAMQVGGSYWLYRMAKSI